MFALTPAVWFLRASLRNPATWILLLVVSLAWPSLQTLMAVGLTTSSGPPQSALFQIGSLGTLLGACLGVYTLCNYSWLLKRTTPARGAAVEWIAIFTSAAAFLVASLAPAWPQLEPNTLWLALGWGAIACLHLAFLGSLTMCLTPRWPAGLRACTLALIAWVLPALTTSEGVLSNVLRQSCEFARYFEFPLELESTAPGWWTVLLPMMGLALLRLGAGQPPTPNTPCATPSSETSTPT